MRGKLRVTSDFRNVIRITPAGAGKTFLLRLYKVITKDHPRRCGENFIRLPRSSASRGSPPQVRGKRRVCRAGCHKHGITPAGAGKTAPSHAGRADRPDHPRRCGENKLFRCCAAGSPGSPPQVRGKLEDKMRVYIESRITPAGAGKTYGLPLHGRRGQDHPRRCGENCLLLYIQARCRGSPPQVRGKQVGAREAGLAQRITPAGAGKTNHDFFRNKNKWDHPRRCGENSGSRGRRQH